jgi:aspartyl-tRNA(Asn)/glutamyl-tRNA(Gln) amidotransferase subunit B
MADYFEETYQESQRADTKISAKVISNWLLGEFSRLLNATNTEISEAKVKPEQLCQLIDLVQKGGISGPSAKAVFEEMFDTGGNATDIIAQRGLSQISDAEELEKDVIAVIKSNNQAVADYKAGKAAALKFLVGQVMRATKGRANPQVVTEVLKRKLEEE